MRRRKPTMRRRNTMVGRSKTAQGYLTTYY